MQPVTLAALFSDARSATKALELLEQSRGDSRNLSLLMRDTTAAREFSVSEAGEADLQLPLSAVALRLASELQPATSLAAGSNLVLAGPLGLLVERAGLGGTASLHQVLERSGVSDEVTRSVLEGVEKGAILVCSECQNDSDRAAFHAVAGSGSLEFELRSSESLLAHAAEQQSASTAPPAQLLSDPAAGPAIEPAPEAPRGSRVGAIPPGEGDAEVQYLPDR